MFLVTGGAGFIGSHIIAEMEARGLGPIVVCDDLGSGDKWRNLAKHTVERFVRPDECRELLNAKGDWITAVIHMGAISSTSETDVGRLIEANIEPFRWTWNVCARRQIPLIYASSASVYGNDDTCLDDDSSEAMARLRPLSPYAWSKVVNDRCAVAWASRGWAPPHWAGLRFFNVFGPREDHKGAQKSFVSKAIDAARRHEPLELFPGDFQRDWIYVGDISRLVVDMLANPPPSGIYNVGSGIPRSFEEVGEVVGDILGYPPAWVCSPMPEAMAKGYQRFTKANISKLQSVMPNFKPLSLEGAIADFVDMP